MNTLVLTRKLLTGSIFAVSLGLFGCEEGSNTAAAPAEVQAVAHTESELPACCEVPLSELPDPRTAAGTDKPQAPPTSNAVAAGAAAVPPAEQSVPATPQPQPAVDAADTQADAATDLKRTEWLSAAERDSYDFNFAMTDQDGNAINLQSLKGKPIAMSFMFTRCTNMQACPLLTMMMGRLEQQVAEAGLSDKVQLVLVTYDPAYDTPERLKKYGSERGIKFINTTMLRPDLERFDLFKWEFQQTSARDLGNGQILHNVDLYLFDKEGRVARFYGNGVWDNDQVMEDFQTLCAE